MDEDRKLPVWALPVLGVVVVVALVIVGLNRAPAEFDPDSPEGTVQLYIDALVDGDFDTASSLWAQQFCLPESAVPTMSTNVAAVLVGMEVNDREGTVRVRLSENSDNSLGGIYEREERFYLVREDDRWRIQQPSWPYYDQLCEEVG